MSIKVDLPFNQAHQLRDEWANRITVLRAEADELEAAVTAIDAQLSGSLAGAGVDLRPTAKRSKGTNFRSVFTFLKSVGVNGATVAEVSKSANVPVSSCMYLLKKHRDVFAKSTDGLWRLKPDAVNVAL